MQCWNETNFEIIWQKFEGSYYYQNVQQVRVNTVQMNGKIESFSKEIEDVKKTKWKI